MIIAVLIIINALFFILTNLSFLSRRNLFFLDLKAFPAADAYAICNCVYLYSHSY